MTRTPLSFDPPYLQIADAIRTAVRNGYDIKAVYLRKQEMDAVRDVMRAHAPNLPEDIVVQSHCFPGCPQVDLHQDDEMAAYSFALGF